MGSTGFRQDLRASSLAFAYEIDRRAAAITGVHDLEGIDGGKQAPRTAVYRGVFEHPPD